MEPFTFFVSYRRGESSPIALLLKYEIEKRLQFVRVIVDVEEFKPGEHFPSRIEDSVASSDATIVLIGRNWLPLRSHQSGPTDFSSDWVVREIQQSILSPVSLESGSETAKRGLIPIFVGGVRSFAEFEIPDAIANITQIQAERIEHASWPTAIGPLIERIAVELNLKKRPDSDEYPPADHAKARTQPLSESDLKAILAYRDYDGWYIDNFGNAEVRYLVKTFRFPHFREAAAFMEMVIDFCNVLGHHPEWRNVFNHVTVSLTTWDARRRVTIYDLNLALFMNKAANAVVQQATSSR